MKIGRENADSVVPCNVTSNDVGECLSLLAILAGAGDTCNVEDPAACDDAVIEFLKETGLFSGADE